MAQRSFVVRALWFVLVGWWLTPILVNVAWLLNVTVILLPVGIKLINLVPTALTLAEPARSRTAAAARSTRWSCGESTSCSWAGGSRGCGPTSRPRCH